MPTRGQQGRRPGGAAAWQAGAPAGRRRRPSAPLPGQYPTAAAGGMTRRRRPLPTHTHTSARTWEPCTGSPMWRRPGGVDSARSARTAASTLRHVTRGYSRSLRGSVKSVLRAPAVGWQGQPRRGLEAGSGWTEGIWLRGAPAAGCRQAGGSARLCGSARGVPPALPARAPVHASAAALLARPPPAADTWRQAPSPESSTSGGSSSLRELSASPKARKRKVRPIWEPGGKAGREGAREERKEGDSEGQGVARRGCTCVASAAMGLGGPFTRCRVRQVPYKLAMCHARAAAPTWHMVKARQLCATAGPASVAR